MSGVSLDDYSDGERSAYEQGATDTHARYEQIQTQAADWLTKTITVVARIEAHERPHSYARRVLAVELRDALSLGWVKLKCSCVECVPRIVCSCGTASGVHAVDCPVDGFENIGTPTANGAS